MDIKINPKFFLFKDMFYVYFFLCIFVYIVWIWDHRTEEEKKMKHSKGKIKEWRTWQETGYVGEEK